MNKTSIISYNLYFPKNLKVTVLEPVLSASPLPDRGGLTIDVEENVKSIEVIVEKVNNKCCCPPQHVIIPLVDSDY